MIGMIEHKCQFPFDESDLGLEVECYRGCGRRIEVIMVDEGKLALREVD
jgi:hypothetical protein